MSYEVISIKVDPLTKKEARHTAEKLGLSLSAVIKGFLKQFIRNKTITFSAAEGEEPSEYLKKVIRQAEEDLKAGRASPTFDNAKDAIVFLDKQGI